MITLANINSKQLEFSIIKKRRVMKCNNKNKYELLNSLNILLSNKKAIRIPKGFIWDLSTTPRIFWNIVPPDGDFELAALIHDYLYINKNKSYLKDLDRKFIDKEMLKWSLKTSGTKNPSLRNLDCYIRYFFVRMLGWLVWKDIIKIK